jgi:hypothetical protein
VNVAVTVVSAVTVVVQARVPEQPPPLQPPNVEPDAGTADRVTAVLAATDMVQVVPQLTPAGLEVTDPEPDPTRDTVSVRVVGVAARPWS